MKTVLAVVIACALVWFFFRMNDRAKGEFRQAVENALDRMDSREVSQNEVIRKAMREQRERENREWTVSNINAHPDLYLEHCGKTLTGFLKLYDDAILETKILLNRYARNIADAREESASLLTFLKDAKRCLSDSGQGYPVKIGLYTYADAHKVADAVRATDRKLTECAKMAEMRESQSGQLRKTLAELTEGRDRVKLELSDLDRKREQAKATNLQKAVDGLRERMNAVLSGVDAVSEGVSGGGGLVAPTQEEESVESIFSRRGI